MDGHVHSFSFDWTKRKAAWADRGVDLTFEPYEGRIRARSNLASWPEHDQIRFEFDVPNLTVQGRLFRKATPEEISECQDRNGPHFGRPDPFCDGLLTTVGEHRTANAGTSRAPGECQHPSRDPPMSRLSTTTEDERIRTHPGEVLREEYLKPLGMSARTLALAIGIPPNRLTEIVRERRSVTADTAIRLGKYFGTDARFWVNLQVSHDLSKAEAATDYSSIPTRGV